MQTIGERIRHIRKTNKLTQADFSKKLCVSGSHIANIENNKDNPSNAVIRLISTTFNINEGWIKNGLDG